MKVTCRAERNGMSRQLTDIKDDSRNTDEKKDSLSTDTKISELLSASGSIPEQRPGFFRRVFSGKKKRFLLLPAALLLLFIIKGIAGNGKSTLPEVPAAPLTKGQLDEALTVTGPVGGSESVDITSSLHAKVTELNVKEGDPVVKGVTLLAKLDDEELRREVSIARGNYELQCAQKEDRQRESQNAYEKAAQLFRAAEKDYKRKSALAATGAIAQTELEAAADALTDARRELSSYTVKNGKVILSKTFDLQIENARQELEKLETRLQSTELIAPISGTVTRVNTRVGRFADDTEDKKPLITIENLEQLQLELLVSEYNIGKVAVGQHVSISADILGKGNSVNGEVTGISPTGEKKSYDSTERVIPVKVSIKDQDSALISGITAKAKIILESTEDSFIVPLSAIGDDGNGGSVMQFILTSGSSSTADTGTITTVPVETGIEGDMDIALKSDPTAALGISDTPYFVRNYNADYSDGMQVRITTDPISEEKPDDGQ